MSCAAFRHVHLRFEDVDQHAILDVQSSRVFTVDRIDFLAELIAAGLVPHVDRREDSPNGLAWPAVQPKPWRHRR